MKKRTVLFKKYIQFIGLFIFVAITLTACSNKISSPKIDKLESQQAILVLNTHLNEVSLVLERTLLENKDLTSAIEKANQDASKSSAEANKFSDELSSDPGNLKLAKKASNAANRAARDAKKASKLNAEFSNTAEMIKKYKEDIASTEVKLKELESKIEFVPNSN